MEGGRTTLPPMPASDEKSLQWNKSDHYYQQKSADFWSGNEVSYVGPEDNIQVCGHYFVSEPGGVKCRKCGTGFIGSFEIKEGKLFYQGLEVGI